LTTPTIDQYLNLAKCQAAQWLGDRAKSRFHVRVKAAARALARRGPAQLVGALMRWLGTCAIACLLAIAGTPAIAAEKTGNVLVIYSSARTLPAMIAFDRGFRQAIKSSPDREVSIFDEYLDARRFLDAPRVGVGPQIGADG
jgi:hypothetical protein